MGRSFELSLGGCFSNSWLLDWDTVLLSEVRRFGSEELCAKITGRWVDVGSAALSGLPDSGLAFNTVSANLDLHTELSGVCVLEEVAGGRLGHEGLLCLAPV